jgi:hypothetical protein
MSEGTEPKKKGGRPKVRSTNVPLIVAESRSRVREEVVMPAHTSRLLKRYVRWASKQGEITKEEAMSLTLSMAIDGLLKRDPGWAEAKRNEEDGTDEDEAPMPKEPAAEQTSTRTPGIPGPAGARNGLPPLSPVKET